MSPHPTELDQAPKLSPDKSSTSRFSTIRRSGSPVKTASSLWDPDEDEFPLGSPFQQTARLEATTPSATGTFEVGLGGGARSASIDGDAQLDALSRTVNLSKSSIWDPEDSEFPDWPRRFGSLYGSLRVRGYGSVSSDEDGTVRHRKEIELRAGVSAAQGEQDGLTNNGEGQKEDESDRDTTGYQVNNDDALRTEEHIRDTISLLLDPSYSSPLSPDTHDALIAPFFRTNIPLLPGSSPARHMHVLDWHSLLQSAGRMTEYARPRLCDAVATVLFETAPACLTQFLDGSIGAFEWRNGGVERSWGLSLVIRREGCRVLVCLFRSHGFKYLVYSLVRSVISLAGQWTDVFGTGRGYVVNTSEGPQWDEFHPLRNCKDGEQQDLEDPVFALYVGRQLAYELVGGSVKYWQCAGEQGEVVEWEADGVMTRVGSGRRSGVDGFVAGFGGTVVGL